MTMLWRSLKQHGSSTRDGDKLRFSYGFAKMLMVGKSETSNIHQMGLVTTVESEKHYETISGGP